MGAMRVMGIDPGLTRLGFGLVESVSGRLIAEGSGTIETSTDLSTAQRLLQLFRALNEAIAEQRPGAIAVERVFFNLNERTAVPVMRASGVALLAAAMSGSEVHEYTPLEVKQAVTGTGTASKNQVRFMVQRLLALDRLPDADAADALAIAICHIHSHKLKELAG